MFPAIIIQINMRLALDHEKLLWLLRCVVSIFAEIKSIRLGACNHQKWMR